MYRELGVHHQPHFHARYGEYKASFNIDPPALLAGNLPRKQERLVLAWAELYIDELLENWQLVQGGESANRIAAL